MDIIKALTAPESPNLHGVSARRLHGTEHVQVSMVTLQPGESLKLHVTPVDVFFYVLQGRGSVEIGVEIGAEREEVSRDMLIVSPAHIPHRLLNESDAEFRFLVVKTPRPTKVTKIL
ncbi:MAG: cupin domain-containing protein [Anaerolineae bacterium]|nr:cupin domain-containing protein [Anaerolineae bacterium]